MSLPDQRRIVIVDDDASMRQALVRIFRLAGYDSLAFESAEALLESSQAANADCLVLDVYLPGLTGLELYAKLETDGIRPPVIFISAYDEPEELHGEPRSKTRSFIAKPFSGRALVAEVGQFFGEAGRRDLD